MKCIAAKDLQGNDSCVEPYRYLKKSGQYVFMIISILMAVSLLTLLMHHFYIQKPLVTTSTQYLEDASFYLHNIMNTINDTSPMYIIDDLLWALDIFFIHAIAFLFFFDNGVATERHQKRHHTPILQNSPWLCMLLILAQCLLSYFLVSQYYALLKIFFTFTISVPMAVCLLLSIFYAICGRAWYGLLYNIMKKT